MKNITVISPEKDFEVLSSMVDGRFSLYHQLNLKQSSLPLDGTDLVIYYFPINSNSVRFDVIDEIKNIYFDKNSLPIIVITDGGSTQDIIECAKAGATQIITYNDVPKKLISTIDIILEDHVTTQKKTLISADNQAIVNKVEREFNILKNTFINMISHEFRTPLTTIMLSNDLLQRYSAQWTKEDKDIHHGRINDTVLRMTTLIEDVLLISRVDSNNFALNCQEIDLQQLCENLCNSLEFNIGSNNAIKLDYKLMSSNIIIDHNLIKIILKNVLINAIKYSRQGDSIDFGVSLQDDNILFKISDQGIGIPENDVPSVYKSFFRGSNIGNREGYGLGLYIAKNCVQIHKGSISIESEEGKGTTVSILIPTNI